MTEERKTGLTVWVEERSWGAASRVSGADVASHLRIVLVEKGGTRVRAEESDGGGKAVGSNTVVGYNCHEEMMGETHSRFWIDDVRVASTVNVDVLMGISRR